MLKPIRCLWHQNRDVRRGRQTRKKRLICTDIFLVNNIAISSLNKPSIGLVGIAGSFPIDKEASFRKNSQISRFGDQDYAASRVVL